mmetsp:Transcript_4518/g.19211  ORF Transcript_4518/g.19211 Transcript_4518/m.19211 type:complete len:352 (-) Transcript_4518:2493-3548(-)
MRRTGSTATRASRNTRSVGWRRMLRLRWAAHVLENAPGKRARRRPSIAEAAASSPPARASSASWKAATASGSIHPRSRPLGASMTGSALSWAASSTSKWRTLASKRTSRASLATVSATPRSPATTASRGRWSIAATSAPSRVATSVSSQCSEDSPREAARPHPWCSGCCSAAARSGSAWSNRVSVRCSPRPWSRPMTTLPAPVVARTWSSGLAKSTRASAPQLAASTAAERASAVGSSPGRCTPGRSATTSTWEKRASGLRRVATPTSTVAPGGTSTETGVPELLGGSGWLMLARHAERLRTSQRPSSGRDGRPDASASADSEEASPPGLASPSPVNPSSSSSPGSSSSEP